MQPRRIFGSDEADDDERGISDAFTTFIQPTMMTGDITHGSIMFCDENLLAEYKLCKGKGPSDKFLLSATEASAFWRKPQAQELNKGCVLKLRAGHCALQYFHWACRISGPRRRRRNCSCEWSGCALIHGRCVQLSPRNTSRAASDDSGAPRKWAEKFFFFFTLLRRDWKMMPISMRL